MYLNTTDYVFKYYIYISQMTKGLCFDKFVISTRDLDGLVDNKDIVLGNITSCSKWRRRKDGFLDKAKDDITSTSANKAGCVSNKFVCNLKTHTMLNTKDLEKFIEKKKKKSDGKDPNFTQLMWELKSFFSMIDDATISIPNSKKAVKDGFENLKLLLRQIISLENDNDLLSNQLQKLLLITDENRPEYIKYKRKLKEENKNSIEFRTNEDEALLIRDSSFKRSTFSNYNTLFYATLTLISGLFIRSQLK